MSTDALTAGKYCWIQAGQDSQLTRSGTRNGNLFAGLCTVAVSSLSWWDLARHFLGHLVAVPAANTGMYATGSGPLRWDCLFVQVLPQGISRYWTVNDSFETVMNLVETINDLRMDYHEPVELIMTSAWTITNPWS